MPVWVVRWIERLALSSAPFSDSIGAIMAKKTGKPRWFSATHIGFEELVRRFAQLKQDSALPHAFVLEAYNPEAETVRMQVSFVPVRDENVAKDLVQLAPSFIKTLAFPAGYSRHVIEVSEFRSVIETARQFLISMIPEADKNARLVFLTADLVRFDREPETAKEDKNIKCIVWDLDNTLWDGVLSEGDEIAIKPEMFSLLKHLDSRGILMSIASKNEHAAAWTKLGELGVAEYFLYPQINWGPKSQSIKKIAERLNIGIDTLAFVDDSSFELDQVASVLPTVTCIDAANVSSLRTNKTFEGSTSANSRQRRKFYRDAIERETEQEKFGRDYMAFLANCNIELELNRYSVDDSERVAELVQRTNQLNFSGRKYTRREMDEILLNSTNEKVVLKCSDRYGSYGTVGFGLIQTEDGVIQVHDFMLSCRVQGKLIEQAFFNHLFEHHNPEGSTTLWVNFRATERNKPAEQVLESLGFRKCDPATDRLSSGLVLSTPETLQCRTIRMRCSVPTLPVVQH
jgi:FkbH-like protein